MRSSQILPILQKTLKKQIKYTPAAILIQWSNLFLFKDPHPYNLLESVSSILPFKSTWDEPFWNNERSQAQLPLTHQGHNNILCPIDATSSTTSMPIHLFSSPRGKHACWSSPVCEVSNPEQGIQEICVQQNNGRETGYLGTTTLSTFWQRLH